MNYSKIRIAAIGAGALIAGVAAFQAALALGLPLGDATYGGSAPTENGVLSAGFRVLAIINAIILLVLAWIILARSGVTTFPFFGTRFLYWASWGIVAFLVINTLGNLSAPHPVERYVMGTVTLVLVILCGTIALRSPDVELER